MTGPVVKPLAIEMMVAGAKLSVLSTGASSDSCSAGYFARSISYKFVTVVERATGKLTGLDKVLL